MCACVWCGVVCVLFSEAGGGVEVEVSSEVGNGMPELMDAPEAMGTPYSSFFKGGKYSTFFRNLAIPNTFLGYEDSLGKC